MKHYIYLAGPITGLTYEGATDWRNQVSERLNSYKIECLSPMRGKEYLQGKGALTSGTYDGLLTTAKGIMRRDHFDCTRATALLVNLLGTKKVSIGTVMEIAWAYDKRIPVIAVMEPDNLHHHVMLDEGVHYTVGTIEDAVQVLKQLFNDLPKENSWLS
jgi:nucleoside 2-deoxyribosyltransferase